MEKDPSMTSLTFGKHSMGQTWKVKVFILNAKGEWDDCGTGVLYFKKEKEENPNQMEEYIKIVKYEEESPEPVHISMEKKVKLSKGKTFPEGECIL